MGSAFWKPPGFLGDWWVPGCSVTPFFSLVFPFIEFIGYTLSYSILTPGSMTLEKAIHFILTVSSV